MKEIKAKCLECGKEFIKKRNSQKFCCKKCGAKNRNKKKVVMKTNKCKICGKEFKSSKSSVLYCSEECKKIGYKKIKDKYKEKVKERERKQREKEKQKEAKIKMGNILLRDINKIAKETGLSYGEVKKWYPDIDKIKFMANYLGRKGMKPDEVRTVGRTSMIIV